MMSDWTTTTFLAFGCLVLLHIARRTSRSRTSYPLPPGPPGLPLVGNIFGIDPDAPWKTYAEWARTYGDLVYSRVLESDIIIINSEKVAKDLLENRSRNYSDRPNLVTVQTIGVGLVPGLIPYGDRWRLQRRFFHQTFRPDATPRFIPLQHHKGCHFLRRLFNSPAELDGHIFEYSASLILNSTYNYDPVSQEDEILNLVRNMLKVLLPAMRPDVAVVVNSFPLLMRLPSWFPGMSFKREMETARECSKQYAERSFEHSLQKVPSGIVAPSMVHDALRKMEESGTLPEESWMGVLKEASASAFLAAADTTNSVLMTFFLMMMLNPAAQEKAHAQIDTVVGRERLPTTCDRPSLPLLDAILWETLRYSPVAPLSLPNAAVEDDVYDGFHIPKGAIILTNLWSMAHNESKYANPHAFIPERFLNDDGSLKPNDIEHIAFGFGRRICPGRHIGVASVWNLIAKVLAVYKILKPLDENGVEIPVEARYSTGITIHPLPFKCRIVPRFPGMSAEKLEELIAASTA